MQTTPSQSAPRAVSLEYATVAVAIGEAVIALISGIMAGSVVLVAFGADSVIEMLSGLVVLTQLKAMVGGSSPNRASEHRAHRIIAVLFFTLVAYVIASATVALVHGSHPSENALGIGVCIVSGLFMPGLALAKRRISVRLTSENSPSVGRLLAADAAETALCGLLSVSTLVGVGLTAWMGWWWADPVSSLAVVYFALREGREAWVCDSD